VPGNVAHLWPERKKWLQDPRREEAKKNSLQERGGGPFCGPRINRSSVKEGNPGGGAGSKGNVGALEQVTQGPSNTCTAGGSKEPQQKTRAQFVVGMEKGRRWGRKTFFSSWGERGWHKVLRSENVSSHRQSEKVKPNKPKTNGWGKGGSVERVKD